MSSADAAEGRRSDGPAWHANSSAGESAHTSHRPGFGGSQLVPGAQPHVRSEAGSYAAAIGAPVADGARMTAHVLRTCDVVVAAAVDVLPGCVTVSAGAEATVGWAGSGAVIVSWSPGTVTIWVLDGTVTVSTGTVTVSTGAVAVSGGDDGISCVTNSVGAGRTLVRKSIVPSGVTVDAGTETVVGVGGAEMLVVSTRVEYRTVWTSEVSTDPEAVIV